MSLEIRDLDVWVEYPEWADPKNYAMIPDELDLMIQRSEADEPEQWTLLCLRGLFTLYSHLVAEESGVCLGMFHAESIEIEGERARLTGQPDIVGTVDEFKATFRPLLVEGLRELEREGIDSEAVCENLRYECEDSPFDPVEFRGELLD